MILLLGATFDWIVGVSEFFLAMCVFAVWPILTISNLQQILALYSFVVAVGLRLIVILLFNHLLEIAWWQGSIFTAEFSIAVCKMTLGSPTAFLEELVVLAFNCFKFIVELRERRWCCFVREIL
jgi:hypothetical protein